jgi:hypothetical protein
MQSLTRDLHKAVVDSISMAALPLLESGCPAGAAVLRERLFC